MKYDIRILSSLFALTDIHGDMEMSDKHLGAINKGVAIRRWGVELLYHILQQVREIEYESN